MSDSIFKPKNFEGSYYTLPSNWVKPINLETTMNTPIKYLEVGTLYGGSLLSFAQTFGLHHESKLFCIDPWIDYPEYPEYKGEQEKIYQTFLKNVENSEHKDKITIMRGFSHDEMPKLYNNFFDIIYVDANHENQTYIYRDAVLSFMKLKKGGVLIFDDYGGCYINVTQAVNKFLHDYRKLLLVNREKNGDPKRIGFQVFVKKL